MCHGSHNPPALSTSNFDMCNILGYELYMLFTGGVTAGRRNWGATPESQQPFPVPQAPLRLDPKPAKLNCHKFAGRVTGGGMRPLAGPCAACTCSGSQQLAQASHKRATAPGGQGRTGSGASA